ncbi:MAG: hypothetical protein HOM58_19260 [Rhodospirillaceae bacterium]|jgi:cytochrome c peroxidase|nr:hypothetical protein [Rhodospirillaceae bacterium]MBT5459658.1 hypothetical protein [Rhodospirillaceae bacterium]
MVKRQGVNAVRSRWLTGLGSVLMIGVLAGCESRTDNPAAFLGAIDNVGRPGQQVILWQNWNDEQRQKFWFTPQGSQIIPYGWVTALEQPDSRKLFFDNGHLDQLRYIPQRPTTYNPDGLPIGFTKDKVWYSKKSRLLEGIRPSKLFTGLRIRYKDYGNPAYQDVAEDWLGVTCAACHTNQIDFKGKKVVIDGAPAMADFEGLMRRLVRSMEATLKDEGKFNRFAEKVFQRGGAKASSKDELKAHLARLVRIRKAWNVRNSGDGLDYGYARLDAINSILNEISAAALGVESNRVSANAPVSYPFIWDAPHHNFIQWNGMVKNDAIGSLGRNVGEVLGVFGSLDLKPPADPDDKFQRTGYDSSVRLPNLGRLEHLLVSLWSPLWPEATLPAINRELAKAGETLFKAKKCAACHHAINPEAKDRRVRAKAIPVRKKNQPRGDIRELRSGDPDPRTADIFFDRTAKTGKLKGQYQRYNPPDADPCKPAEDGKFAGDTSAAAKFLAHAVAGTLVHDKVAVGNIYLNTRLFVPQKIKKCPPKRASYKARPLNGVWATAPYLHNGSVPTLWQLLKKPSDRVKSFMVGSREFDPVEVGFKYKASAYGPSDPKFRLDTQLSGNRNTGHAYPKDGLTDGEIAALVEYMKTL